MRQFLSTLLFLTALTINGFAGASCADCRQLVFKQNKGQWDERIVFNAPMKGGNMLLEKGAFTYNLFSLDDLKRIRGDQHHQHSYTPDFDKTFHCHAFRVSFIGASTTCQPQGTDKLSEYFNYFIGNDKSKWASRVAGYREVRYPELYKGIALNVYSDKANVKYDFVIKAGSSPEQIKLSYAGVNSLQLIDKALHVTTSLGTAVEQAPYAYQLINGVKTEVECAYVLNGNELSFAFPKGYNKQYELVIDPTLIFSTFSGSFADNFGYSATYDSRKNAYAAGSVFINEPGGGYPVTLGAYQTTWAGGTGAGSLSGTDIGITKYSADGTSRIYSTYLGGVSDELPHSLIVNSNDELFIFGTTSSNNFPTTANAYDRTFAGGPNPNAFNGLGVHYQFGSDIVITRLSNDGTQLLASTYVGGTGNDGLNISTQLLYNYADQVRGEIDIDDQNNVYVVTCTRSADFPITGSPFQPAYAGGGLDGVIIKMNNNLTNIIWSSYIGGNDDDAVYSLSLDKNDDLYITGGTQSTNFPVTTGSLQQTFAGGDCDGFVAHISKTGQQILQSSYYGYSDYDQAFFIEANRNDEVFLLGQVESSGSNYIRNAAYNVVNGGLFITKLKPQLDTIVWSTSLGQATGIPPISPTAFLVDLCNKVYVAGWGGAVNGFGGTAGLPVTNDAHQSTTDNSDFYLMVIEDDASALSYATYFGGPVSQEHVDGGTSRFDRGGVVYQSVCAGCGNNDDFPTTAGAVSQVNNSPNCNNGVFKFDFNLPIVLADFNVSAACAGIATPITNTSTASGAATYSWTFGDGGTSAQQNPQHTFTQSGVYTITLIVSDPGTCNFSDTAQAQILVLSSAGTDILSPATICPAQSVQIGLPPTNDTTLTYQWSPTGSLNESDVSNPIASPLATTTYQLLVSNGVCTDTFRQTVTVTTDDLNITNTPITCPGDTTVLSATSNSGNTFVQYTWTPAGVIIAGAATANPLAVITADTTVYLTAQTSLGCLYSDSVRILLPPPVPLNADFLLPASGCLPDTAEFTSTGDEGPGATYLWNFGDGTTSTLQNPIHIYTQGNIQTITLVVRDNSGCLRVDSVTKQLILLSDTTYPLPAITICYGDTTLIGFAATGNTYTWQPAATLSNAAIPNPQAFPLDTTTYLLEISNGVCSDSIFQTVNVVYDSISINPDMVICSGSNIQLQANHLNIAVPLVYDWSPNASIVSGDSTATPTVWVGQTTTFVVTAQNSYQCQYTDSVTISIFTPAPNVVATATPDTIKLGQTSQLQADSTNAVWLMWNADSTLSALDIVNPVASPRETRAYVVEVRDGNGCAKTDTVWVYLERTPCEQTTVYIPNAFSPNGDGKNDVLYVRANNVTQLYFAVYDRWGQKMFDTKDISKGWDGTFNGKKIDPAVFGWYAEGLCDGGKKFELKGNVTLIR
ncbi:MAG TPA: PKD domain-containing protein [Chitinophagales bacterium]|nr:PKD domain-containing protein [Chitinophagales bacterium]